MAEYNTIITRENPSAFIIMLNVSGSMGDIVTFNGEATKKHEAVAFIINDLISELISRCKREEYYGNYFDIAILGYDNDEIRSLLPESADHRFFRKPSELAKTKNKKI